MIKKFIKYVNSFFSLKREDIVLDLLRIYKKDLPSKLTINEYPLEEFSKTKGYDLVDVKREYFGLKERGWI